MIEDNKKQINEIGNEYLKKEKQRIFDAIDNFISAAKLHQTYFLDLSMDMEKPEKRLFIIMRIK